MPLLCPSAQLCRESMLYNIQNHSQLAIDLIVLDS